MKRRYSNFILRLGIGLVFFWAGISKLFLGFKLPIEKITLMFQPTTAVLLLGVIELCLGVMLLIGLLTRFMAISAGVITLFYITYGFFLGASDISYIGLGILGGCISLALEGCKLFGLDEVVERQNEN